MKFRSVSIFSQRIVSLVYIFINIEINSAEKKMFPYSHVLACKKYISTKCHGKLEDLMEANGHDINI